MEVETFTRTRPPLEFVTFTPRGGNARAPGTGAPQPRRATGFLLSEMAGQRNVDRGLDPQRGVPAGAARRALRPWCRAEQGQAAVHRMPGTHRVPRRGARQPDRVGRVGRYDRAGEP